MRAGALAKRLHRAHCCFLIALTAPRLNTRATSGPSQPHAHIPNSFRVASILGIFAMLVILGTRSRQFARGS